MQRTIFLLQTVAIMLMTSVPYNLCPEALRNYNQKIYSRLKRMGFDMSTYFISQEAVPHRMIQMTVEVVEDEEIRKRVSLNPQF